MRAPAEPLTGAAGWEIEHPMRSIIRQAIARLRMLLQGIKKEYGNQICLRGGISTQKTLANGSVQDVKDETKRIIDHLAPGGGYILSPGHPVLQDEVPIKNVIAMYETAYDFGFY